MALIGKDIFSSVVSLSASFQLNTPESQRRRFHPGAITGQNQSWGFFQIGDEALNSKQRGGMNSVVFGINTDLIYQSVMLLWTNRAKVKFPSQSQCCTGVTITLNSH